MTRTGRTVAAIVAAGGLLGGASIVSAQVEVSAGGARDVPGPEGHISAASPQSADLAQCGTIYVIGYENQSGFWKSEEAGANQAGEDFGVEVIFQAPQEASTEGMVQLARAALASEPYGILLNYLDDGMADVTEEALDAGVEVALFNNNLFTDETPARITELSYVGQNNAPGPGSSGDTLGQAFLAYVESGDTVLIVNPFPQAFVLDLRYEGVRERLEAEGVTTDLLVATADEGQNQQLISSYLQANPDIDGIIGLGTPGANPAAQAAKAAGLDIPIGTFDVDSAAYENMLNGDLTVAIHQAPFLQTYLAVQNLVLKCRFGFQPVHVNTGNAVITEANLEDMARLVEAEIS